jgi:hypothetical protein
MRPVWMLLRLGQAPSLDGPDNQPLGARISRVIRVTSVNPVAKRVAAYSAFGIVAALTIMVTSCGNHKGPEYDIKIASIDCSPPATATESAHCTGTLRNGGPVPLTRVRLTVIHDDGSESTSSATDLPAGEAGDFDILLRIERPTSYCFTAREFGSCRTLAE